jgi:hypothetical protein
MFRKCFITLFAAICVMAVIAQGGNVSLTGTIIDQESGGPVDSAFVSTVLFMSQGFDRLSGLTDKLGKFSMTGSYNAVSSFSGKAPEDACHELRLMGTTVMFPPALNPISGRITIFSSEGKRIADVPFNNGPKKSNVTLPRLSPGFHVLQLSAGPQSFTRALICTGDRMWFGAGSDAAQAHGESMLARRMGAVDTLIAVKRGMIDAKVPVESYSRKDIGVMLSRGVCRRLFTVKDNEIPGWRMGPESFSVWSASNLSEDIDGGAEHYIDRGMLQAAEISMTGPVENGKTAMVSQYSFIMDFATTAKAKAMYDSSRAAFLLNGQASMFDSVSFYREALDGIIAYSHCRQFYFELIFAGFSGTEKALVAAKTLLNFFRGKIDGSSATIDLTVEMLKVKNGDIANWRTAPDADSFGVWTPDNFYEDIDGGYEVYTDQGLSRAADFHMLGPVGPDGDTEEIAKPSFIMDFGSATHAMEMYTYMKSMYSADIVATPGWNDSVAFAKSILGGIAAYVHFDKFYFELNFAGFSDREKALAAAGLFLDFFKGKIDRR